MYTGFAAISFSFSIIGNRRRPQYRISYMEARPPFIKTVSARIANSKIASVGKKNNDEGDKEKYLSTFANNK